MQFDSMISPTDAALSLLEYCCARDWSGHDPYDALNSELFKALPFLDSRLPRLVMTQLLKRSPVDVRGLLRVPPTQNAKALGLFLQACLKLDRAALLKQRELISGLIDKILATRSAGFDYWAWGYSFPWQTRTMVVPRGTPNLVCTTFVANALLDAYDATEDVRCLEAATSAADYMVGQLFWSEGEVNSFNYPLKTSCSRIHNANFLAAAFLCRVSQLTGEKKYVAPAFAVARYSASKQAPDGSWVYGELPTQQWIDNFHTGYNLAGLRDIGRYANTGEFEDSLRRGFRFYREHFVRSDGAPKYFHNGVYPIDVHCLSQSIITLTEFRDLHPPSIDLARKVYAWGAANMRDKEAFFYYRVLPWCKIRTSYMRWGQAWMLLSLSTLVEAEQAQKVETALAT